MKVMKNMKNKNNFMPFLFFMVRSVFMYWSLLYQAIVNLYYVFKFIYEGDKYALLHTFEDCIKK